MFGTGESERDLALLVVPANGQVEETGDPWEPYRLVDPDGAVVVPVREYLKDLQAAGRSCLTQRSYSMDLLRWFRFLWAAGIGWDQATRAEARDFCRWVQLPDRSARGARARGYAPSTRLHCETVLRSFYEYHLQAGTGPIVNPFPLARAGRRHAHHNPMDEYGKQPAGLFRPKLPQRLPRQIPDEQFNELFAALPSDRDRALVAFWVSTGARASELLGVICSGVDPGQQLITVIRKGSRVLQPLPASPDAFVWLRLYQQQMHGLAPAGPDDPLWWTLRSPFRALTYHAARMMLVRAGATLDARWSLHDLRHTAAYRMARDPQMPITDVQWVLGHAHLSTTQIYVRPAPADVIENVLAHHHRQASEPPPSRQPAPGYRPETMDILFGRQGR
jgi:site-specific recombinase XerD